MTRAFTILAFNALIVSILFAPFAQVFTNDARPSFVVFLFIISVYAATILIVSSYHVGRVIFNRDNNKILSAGFFYALIGYILLMFATLGYMEYVKGFVSPENIVTATMIVASFVAFPMLAAKPNRRLLKAISRVTKEF